MDTNITKDELITEIIENLQTATKEDLLIVLAFLSQH